MASGAYIQMHMHMAMHIHRAMRWAMHRVRRTRSFSIELEESPGNTMGGWANTTAHISGGVAVGGEGQGIAAMTSGGEGAAAMTP